ncbi:hypothetical protein YC2023_031405 [Brassica napus]|uniref:(rape) hypothetical protein n=1 Tax=Brassica napus TaxID=3708 RepID=A0A816W3P6_BRANA|nr:unnamed protein product [Brassica napus]
MQVHCLWGLHFIDENKNLDSLISYFLLNLRLGDVSSYETSSDNNGGGYCKDGRREGEGYKSGGHGRGGGG